jgi:hypothetical protein
MALAKSAPLLDAVSVLSLASLHAAGASMISIERGWQVGNRGDSPDHLATETFDLPSVP